MSKKQNSSGWPGIPSMGTADFANPLMNNPLASSLSGGFDFVKNLWGGLPASIPGFVVPTVDLEELDKRITDLKAVESWLALNANMLRATIQSLEVQRNTIATLKSFGAGFSGTPGELLGRLGKASAASAPGGYANWPNPGSAAKSAPKSAPAAVSPAAAPPAAPRNTKTSRAKSTPAPADPPAVGLTPASWLGYLQDQFNQVAQAAIAGKATPASSAAATPGGATKGATKGTAKSLRASRASPKRVGSKTPP
jgi:hypothetical protein